MSVYVTGNGVVDPFTGNAVVDLVKMHPSVEAPAFVIIPLLKFQQILVVSLSEVVALHVKKEHVFFSMSY